MKQLFFDGKGQLLIQDIPAPVTLEKGAFVKTHASLISSGTELSQSTGGGSLLKKAIAQPELVGRAFQLALREGLAFTARAVQDVSTTWFPVGYSSAGIIEEVGPDAVGLRAGMRVACSGSKYATHAEFQTVPQNLLVPIPDNVSYQEAAFTTVGAIALQGVRRAKTELGDTVVVVGLGLIGQITAQLLNAAGCNVIGIDLVPERLALAEQLAHTSTIDASSGTQVKQVMTLTHGMGADKVILCASTRSSDPTNQAFDMCRERGRVVMVGAMGMDLVRTTFYNRELDFVISRSTGPGRYDPTYEEDGIDYPVGHVRWTEQRNMSAFLSLVASNKVNVKELITASHPIEEAATAYERVAQGALAVLLDYPSAQAEPAVQSLQTVRRNVQPITGKIGLALIGAGSFARSMHLPNIKNTPEFDLRAVVSGSASSAQVAELHNLPMATTNLEQVLTNNAIDAVLISTQHHLHAQQALAALDAGKHVFVEKPMALTLSDCEAILAAAEASKSLVAVGFNRRAAPLSVTLQEALKNVNGPKTITFRVNAGPLSDSHWLNDFERGGGRLLGEGVHFIDFICGLIDTVPITVTAQGSVDEQHFSLIIRFEDDSVGTVIYTPYGDTRVSKEFVEVFAGGGVAVLEDFKQLTLTSLPGRSNKGRQDKGHQALLKNFAQAIHGREDLIVTGADGLRATRIALAARQSMRMNRVIDLRERLND